MTRPNLGDRVLILNTPQGGPAGPKDRGSLETNREQIAPPRVLAGRTCRLQKVRTAGTCPEGRAAVMPERMRKSSEMSSVSVMNSVSAPFTPRWPTSCSGQNAGRLHGRERQLLRDFRRPSTTHVSRLSCQFEGEHSESLPFARVIGSRPRATLAPAVEETSRDAFNVR